MKQEEEEGEDAAEDCFRAHTAPPAISAGGAMAATRGHGSPMERKELAGRLARSTPAEIQESELVSEEEGTALQSMPRSLKSRTCTAEADREPRLQQAPAENPGAFAQGVPHSQQLQPSLSLLDTAPARQQVLEWLLGAGFAGDCNAMNTEVFNFLLQARAGGSPVAGPPAGPAGLPEGPAPKTEAEAAQGEVKSLPSKAKSGLEDEVKSLPSKAKSSLVDEADRNLNGARAFSKKQGIENEVFWRVPSWLKGHVIVFGVSNVSGLRDLVRLILLKSDRAVVVLSPDARRLAENAMQDGWLSTLPRCRKISSAGNTSQSVCEASIEALSIVGTRRLYFVVGNPSIRRTLERVQLQHASAAIFLPCVPPQGLSAEATERQHRMIDGATVALTNFAAGEAAEELWTVTQLLHGAAVKFFSDNSAWRASSADPRWLDIAPLNTHALFAAGQIVAGTMLDRLLIETYFNEKAIPLIGLFIFGDEAGSQLFQKSLPETFVGRTYHELCIHLLQRRLLPIGLLRDSHRSYSNIFTRTRKPSTNSSGVFAGAKRTPGRSSTPSSRFLRSRSMTDFKKSLTVATGNLFSPPLDTSCKAQLPYVVTNPDAAFVLKENDVLFVLGKPSADRTQQRDVHSENSCRRLFTPVPASFQLRHQANSSRLSGVLHSSSFLSDTESS